MTPNRLCNSRTCSAEPRLASKCDLLLKTASTLQLRRAALDPLPQPPAVLLQLRNHRRRHPQFRQTAQFADVRRPHSPPSRHTRCASPPPLLSTLHLRPRSSFESWHPHPRTHQLPSPRLNHTILRRHSVSRLLRACNLSHQLLHDGLQQLADGRHPHSPPSRQTRCDTPHLLLPTLHLRNLDLNRGCQLAQARCAAPPLLLYATYICK